MTPVESLPKPHEAEEAAADSGLHCSLEDGHCGCPPSHVRMKRVSLSIVGVLLLAIVGLELYIRFTG